MSSLHAAWIAIALLHTTSVLQLLLLPDPPAADPAAASCRLEVACAFSCSDKVMCTGMSSCGSHALIAVGTKKPGVVLADVASGAFTHTLSGHL